MSTDNSLLRRWFDEVWNAGNASAIDKYMDRQAVLVDKDPPGEYTGSDHVKQVFEKLMADFKELHFSVGEVIIQDDREIAGSVVVTALYEGRPVRVQGPAEIRIKNGKIIWASNDFDLRLNDYK